MTGHDLSMEEDRSGLSRIDPPCSEAVCHRIEFARTLLATIGEIYCLYGVLVWTCAGPLVEPLVDGSLVFLARLFICFYF